MATVLLIESDLKLQLAYKYILTYKGFQVSVCPTIKQARLVLKNNVFQLIMIGIHNLEESSFNFVKELRKEGCFSPVLYIGERTYQEILQKQTTGLDNYLLTPFSISDFNERIHNTLLKSFSSRRPLLYSGINVDEKKLLLSVQNKEINLGRMEMHILKILAKKAGRKVSLDHLYFLVEQEGIHFNNRIFSYISSLRQKLENAGIQSLKIHFVKDGYKLEII
jgi:DNA-binding response OmpR family regulator